MRRVIPFEHFLGCGKNQLTALDVSKNTALAFLECHSNQIRGAAMDELIASLPQNDKSYIYKFYVIDPITESEGNVCTKSQVDAVKAKGWFPCYWNDEKREYVEYEGTTSGIRDITADRDQSAPVYTVSGQRIEKSRKGLNIIGGKKVVVK